MCQFMYLTLWLVLSKESFTINVRLGIVVYFTQRETNGKRLSNIQLVLQPGGDLFSYNSHFLQSHNQWIEIVNCVPNIHVVLLAETQNS
jgi:hypothetical protein